MFELINNHNINPKDYIYIISYLYTYLDIIFDDY